MPPLLGNAFCIKIPIEGKATFEMWLGKKIGAIKTQKIVGSNHVFEIILLKCSRSDNLLASLRTLFIKKRLPVNNIQIKLIKHPFPFQPNITSETSVEEMREILKQLLIEMQTLRETPTVINNVNNNNNLIIFNFGEEDMSHLRPPIDYLENALEGMSELLDAVYFNDDKPCNHTVRVNIASRTAEIKVANGWKTIELPAAATKMIDKCGSYMLLGYDADRHKENTQVMNFTSKLHSPGEGPTAPLKPQIYAKLMNKAIALG